MSVNEHVLQTTLPNKAYSQKYQDLLMGQVKEKKDKADPSHFNKIYYSESYICIFGFCHTNKVSDWQNQKSQFPAHP